jgi:hypothetical protein
MRWGIALIVCGLLLATSVSWAASRSKPRAAARDPVPAVGAGANGQHAFEFTGRIGQNGNALVSYGYLTHVRGLTDTSLFTNPVSRSEATARFTYYGAANVTGRAVNGSTIFILLSRGNITFHFNPAAGAAFDDPPSFRRGRAIATLTNRQQSIVNVISSNQGVLTVMGEATQARAGTFTLQRKQYRFGRRGLREAVMVTGQGIRSQVSPPVASFAIAGANLVTR